MRNLIGLFVMVVILGCAGFIGCASTPPTADAERTDAAAPETVSAAGQSFYDTHCASCHRLGNYDMDGGHDLAGESRRIKPSFLSRHRGLGLTVTDAEAQQLKLFVAGQ